jgi:hypothetical protein
MNRTLVVIPTYNCKSQILELLNDIYSYVMRFEISFLVIDNLSTDGTFEATRDFIAENKLKNMQSFQSVQNNNLGGTHKIAFNKAIAESWDYVGILHGDNQANYRDLIRVLDLIQNNQAKGSYLGSRFSHKSHLIGYAKKRILGNLVLNLIYSVTKWRKLVDLGSGLNLYYVEDLKKLNYLSFGDSLTFNYELILAMIDSKLPFVFVPIEWRESGQVSNARNFNIFLTGIRILISNKLRLRKRFSLSGKIYDVKSNDID